MNERCASSSLPRSLLSRLTVAAHHRQYEQRGHASRRSVLPHHTGTDRTLSRVPSVAARGAPALQAHWLYTCLQQRRLRPFTIRKHARVIVDAVSVVVVSLRRVFVQLGGLEVRQLRPARRGSRCKRGRQCRGPAAAAPQHLRLLQDSLLEPGVRNVAVCRRCCEQTEESAERQQPHASPRSCLACAGAGRAPQRVLHGAV